MFASWMERAVGAAVGRKATQPLQTVSYLFKKGLVTHI